MFVKIRLGTLRKVIRNTVLEAGGGSSHFPIVRDAMAPSTTDREAIEKQSKFDIKDDPDSLPPHLREPEVQEDPDDCFGPVPPNTAGDPYLMTDPHAQDWHASSTGARRGRFT